MRLRLLPILLAALAGSFALQGQGLSPAIYADYENGTDAERYVSLPDFTKPVGTIPGNVSVSPSGGAVYSVPIDIMPGIDGVQPEVSLVYNSQCGNGTLGWG